MSESSFTGKEEDVEVGLQYFGKRYYAPLLNRWVSADPLAVHVPGEADFNLYAYVRGAALKATDPLGLQDAAYERYGENTWADQGFEDFGEGRPPAVERGATVVFDTETIIGDPDPGQAPPQWTGLHQNTPEGNPETKGMLLRKQAALDTGVNIGEMGLVVADLATFNLTPLPSAELALFRRADKVAEIGEALGRGRRLDLGAEVSGDASKIRAAFKPNQGNIATARLEMEGTSVDSFAAMSGADRLRVPIFEAKEVNGYLRNVDAEYKLLSNFAQKYSPSTKARLHLFSEKPMCDSCTDVVRQFQLVFPKIEVIKYGKPVGSL